MIVAGGNSTVLFFLVVCCENFLASYINSHSLLPYVLLHSEDGHVQHLIAFSNRLIILCCCTLSYNALLK